MPLTTNPKIMAVYLPINSSKTPAENHCQQNKSLNALRVMFQRLWVEMIPQLKSFHSVSTSRLRSVWKKISDKPLPDVYAFVLEDKEFLSTLDLLRKQENILDTRVREYGLDFPNEYIEACTFKFKESWIILVKKSVSLHDALEHELSHIHSGNVSFNEK
jgi:hypothetical protein